MFYTHNIKCPGYKSLDRIDIVLGFIWRFFLFTRLNVVVVSVLRHSRRSLDEWIDVMLVYHTHSEVLESSEAYAALEDRTSSLHNWWDFLSRSRSVSESESTVINTELFSGAWKPFDIFYIWTNYGASSDDDVAWSFSHWVTWFYETIRLLLYRLKLFGERSSSEIILHWKSRIYDMNNKCLRFRTPCLHLWKHLTFKDNINIRQYNMHWHEKIVIIDWILI